MSMADLEAAFRIIDENGGDFEGSKPEFLIEAAEGALGLSFPPTYRRFLLEYGCGDIAGVEIYGVIKSDFVNSSVPDAIWLTLRQRDEGQLSTSGIVVYSNGDGSYAVLNANDRSSDDECPVVEWTPGADGDLKSAPRLADDFGAFLFQTVSDAIE